MRPSSTSDCTNEWSWVICDKVSPRRRYARESPMWARATLLPARRRAVTVVPMPWSSGLCSTRDWISALAAARVRLRWSVASSPPWLSPSRETIVPIAMELAMSPPACPPIPSATTRRCGPAYPESWFSERTRPTSERAA